MAFIHSEFLVGGLCPEIVSVYIKTQTIGSGLAGKTPYFGIKCREYFLPTILRTDIYTFYPPIVAIVPSRLPIISSFSFLAR